MLFQAKSACCALLMGLSSYAIDSRPWGARVGRWAGAVAAVGLALGLSFGTAQAQTITRLAGTGVVGNGAVGGQALATQLNTPRAVAVEPDGNVLVMDGFNSRLLRINSATGVMSLVATTGENAQQIALDVAGNIFFADPTNHRIRRVDRASGAVTTVAGSGVAGFADGPSTAAQFNFPNGLAFDRSGRLIVGDTQNHRVRRIDLVGNAVTTIAGTGANAFGGDGAAATAALLNRPAQLAVDAMDRVVLIDLSNRRIRRFLPGGPIETLAGNGAAGFGGDNGPATAATLADTVLGIAIDGAGRIYLGDHQNHRIRAFLPGGNISTVVGSNGIDGLGGDNGPALNAEMGGPGGLWIDNAGNLWIAQSQYDVVRRVSAVAPPPVPPDTAFTIPAPGGLPAAAVSTATSGTAQSLTIRVSLDFSQRPQAEGLARNTTPATTPRPPFQVFVIALVPGRLLQAAQPVLFLQDSQNRWSLPANPLQAFARNVDPATLNQNRLVVTILENFNTTLLPGTEFYLGYGSDANEMIAAGRYRGVYKVLP